MDKDPRFRCRVPNGLDLLSAHFHRMMPGDQYLNLYAYEFFKIDWFSNHANSPLKALIGPI